MKSGMVADGAIVRNDIELGPGKPPPGLGNSAIGDEAFMQDIAIFLALCPLALEVEGVAGGQQSRTRHNLGWRCPAHIPEDPGLVIVVVGAVIALDFVAFQIILEPDMSARLYYACVFVVIYFISLKLPVCGIQHNVAA